MVENFLHGHGLRAENFYVDMDSRGLNFYVDMDTGGKIFCSVLDCGRIVSILSGTGLHKTNFITKKCLHNVGTGLHRYCIK